MKNKYYQYYQPNDKDLKDKFGDCQIRALSKVFNKSWVETFDITVPICRLYQINSLFNLPHKLEKEALEKLGFEYTGITNKKGSKRPTVQEFAQKYRKGKFILNVSNHVVACVDGKYYDTWDCGYKSMYGFYKLKDENYE